jgi:hypothetical protein
MIGKLILGKLGRKIKGYTQIGRSGIKPEADNCSNIMSW